MPDFSTDPQEAIKEFLEKQKDSPHVKNIQELLSLVAKARREKASAQQPAKEEKPDSDCPEDVEDCSEVVSPCCNSPMSTIFGTLPLKVRCKQCEKEYFFGPLMKELLKRAKTPGSL